MSESSDSEKQPILYEVAEREAVKTTIVGARPPGSGRGSGAIPRGIEVLIKKASVDPAFRNLLLEKRADSAHEIGLELSRAEVTMLEAISSEQIEAIIDNTIIPNEQRRIFLGKAATAMLATLGSGLTGCGSIVKKFTFTGIQPSLPPLPPIKPKDKEIGSKKSERPSIAQQGIRSDMPSSPQEETPSSPDKKTE